MMLHKAPTLQPLLLAFLFIGISTRAAASPNGQFRIDYTVAVSSPETNLFHVTAELKNIRQAHLDLSLPTWGPGFYTMRNYAKHILRFRITDAKGASVPYTRMRKQTWSVDTRHLNQVAVEFDYRADTLAGTAYVPQLNEATIAKDFAFFTGVQLFLMADGHRDAASAVHFVFPTEWKIISALKETSDARTFTALDYDTLVDAPTLMGRFDVSRFMVEGKPHYLAATPAGAFSEGSAKKLTDMFAEVATSESAIFGSLPYEKYIYFYFILPPEESTGEGGALEHLNSHVAFVPAGDFPMEPVAWTAAHEFFHLWNVKRIRPIEMWPYDYQRENESPLLWVSEGFSNYYANRTLLRLGLNSQKRFLDRLAGAIRDVETSPARSYDSPAEASVLDCLPEKVFGPDYYRQGQNLAGLLDLSIRNDTHGKASLDDVMRSLFRECYQRGKGFSTEDMIGIVNHLTKRDYHDFYRRYVWGVEVPPYDTIYGYAGYRVNKTIRKLPRLGFGVERGSRVVTSVATGSPAAEAGLLIGDVITAIDGQEPNSQSVVAKMNSTELIGKTIKLAIRRASEEQGVLLKVGSRDGGYNYDLLELPGPTAEQLTIRANWLNVPNQNQRGPSDPRAEAR
jgi:predicted metalloprotease with PDZ domain